MKCLTCKRFFTFIACRSRSFNFSFGLVCALVVCLFDYLTPLEYSFTLFYLFPISFTTWFAGRTAGLLIAIISASNWTLINHAHAIHLLLWNSLSIFGNFLAVCLLVNRVNQMWQQASAQSRSDYLTGICNSRAFMEKLDYEVSRAQREGHVFSLGYIDLDNFKEVNDRYGHNTGDLLLQTVARCFTAGLRRTDLIARMGGDEFCIYFPDTDAGAVRVVMEKIRQHLLQEMQLRGWPTTFSMGVVTCTIPPASADAIIRYADEIMFRAKRSGKNRIDYALFPASAACGNRRPVAQAANDR